MTPMRLAKTLLPAVRVPLRLVARLLLQQGLQFGADIPGFSPMTQSELFKLIELDEMRALLDPPTPSIG